MISVPPSTCPPLFVGLLCVISLCVLNGCTSTAEVRSQADLFRDRYPKESESYVVLSPAPSKQNVDFLLETHHGAIRNILYVIRQRLENPEEVEDTLEFLSDFDWESHFRDAAGEGEHFERIKAGDELYFFVYRHPSSQFTDHGYLVLREGRIVFRLPHDEEGNKEVLEQKGLSVPYYIDDL